MDENDIEVDNMKKWFKWGFIDDSWWWDNEEGIYLILIQRGGKGGFKPLLDCGDDESCVLDMREKNEIMVRFYCKGE